MSNHEVTKREILFSVIIICIMLTMGFFFGTAIDNSVKESNELYYKAVKIDNDPVQFNYGMKTNIGNALIYGEFVTVDPVSTDKLIGEYSSIMIETQQYIRKTRTVTETDSDGNTKTKTEVYYEWDIINQTYINSKEVIFLENIYPINKFDIRNGSRLYLNEDTVASNYIDKVSWNYIYNGSTWLHSVGDLRYCYYVSPVKFSGTILAVLKDGTISSLYKNKIEFHNNKMISQIIEQKQNSEDIPVIVFWVIWISLTVLCVGGFIYLDNRWLNR